MDGLRAPRRCSGAPELRHVPQHPAAWGDGAADEEAARQHVVAVNAGDPVARPAFPVRAGPLALERRDPPGDLPDVRVPPLSRLRLPHLQSPAATAQPEARVHAGRAILPGVGTLGRLALLDHPERELRGGAPPPPPRAGADRLPARDAARAGRPPGPEDAAAPSLPVQRVAHDRLAGAHGGPRERRPRHGGSRGPAAARAPPRRAAGGAAGTGARSLSPPPWHTASSRPPPAPADHL